MVGSKDLDALAKRKRTWTLVFFSSMPPIDRLITKIKLITKKNGDLTNKEEEIQDTLNYSDLFRTENNIPPLTRHITLICFSTLDEWYVGDVIMSPHTEFYKYINV